MALSNLRPEQRGNAAGLFNLTRELGGSIGTAWMSSALSRSTQLNTTALASHVDVYSQVAQEQLAGMQGTARREGRANPAGAAYGMLSLRISAPGAGAGLQRELHDHRRSSSRARCCWCCGSRSPTPP